MNIAAYYPYQIHRPVCEAGKRMTNRNQGRPQALIAALKAAVSRPSDIFTICVASAARPPSARWRYK